MNQPVLLKGNSLGLTMVLDPGMKFDQLIKAIMVYKKENGLPILQPEQEKRQRKMLLTHVDENTYKDEILDIFTYIVENSRRIQAKTLFTHNILLIWLFFF